MADPSTARVRAHAKLNLSLQVVGRRPDGFHNIESWMQYIDWYDTLSLSPADAPGIRLTCNHATLSVGEDNLIHRAITALAAQIGQAPRVDIHLDKQLPLGGGIGGGSANAGAVLRVMARWWGIEPSSPQLRRAAEQIGSDVPFFLQSHAVIASGRGTELHRHPRPFDGWAVLVLPEFGISTPLAYQAWSAQDQAESRAQMCAAVEFRDWRDAAELSLQLRNDLTMPACQVEPRLRQVIKAVDGHAGARVHMSGSGSTLFALFDAEQSALAWKSAIASRVPLGTITRVVRVLSRLPADQCE